MNALFLSLLMFGSSGNPQLRAMFEAGRITGLDNRSVQSFEQWSTSYMPAPPVSGKAPPADSLAERTYRYSAYSARDGRSSTAWCEGAAGDGVGEIVIGPQVSPVAGTEIWVGNGRLPAVYAAGSRPKRVRVYLLGVSRYDLDIDAQAGAETYQTMRVLASTDIALEDVNRFQDLPLPTLSADDARNFGKAEARMFVALQILETVAGTKAQDTCITEIRQSLPAASRQTAQVLQWSTPWPAVSACAPLHLVSATTPSPSLIEWRSSGESLTLGPRQSWSPVGVIDATFNTLVVSAPLVGDDFAVTWRLDCDRNENGGTIAWTCKRAGCTALVSYPVPATYQPSLTTCAKLQACDSLADVAHADGVSTTNKAFVTALTVHARAVARELGAAVQMTCAQNRCTAGLSRVGAVADLLAKKVSWSLREIKADVPQGGGKSAGGIAMFSIPTIAESVALVCARESETGERGAMCELAFDVANANIQYSGDSEHNQQYLQFGRALVLIDLNTRQISLGGEALRLKP